MLATSARLGSLVSSFSWRIQMIFPSRSISNLFDLSRYLSIVFILIEFKVGWSNFRKSLTFGYPFTFCILVRKKSISSSVISFEGRTFFFFVNLLDLIYCYCICAFKALCNLWHPPRAKASGVPSWSFRKDKGQLIHSEFISKHQGTKENE